MITLGSTCWSKLRFHNGARNVEKDSKLCGGNSCTLLKLWHVTILMGNNMIALDGGFEYDADKLANIFAYTAPLALALVLNTVRKRRINNDFLLVLVGFFTLTIEYKQSSKMK